MRPSHFFPAAAASALSALQPFSPSAFCSDAPSARPNILFILADDMGLGDVSAYNPNSAWKTPNIDRLAREGMRFTDAHSTAAVCTPSRYSILTGRYNWRSARKKSVGGALDKPLIEPGRPTVATLLKENGYETAMLGKWHLGIDWPRKNTAGKTKQAEVDYTKPFGGGPTAHGFDYFLGLGTSAGAPPYVWLINDRVDPASFPLRQTEGPKNDPQRRWSPGVTGNNFEQADMLPRITKEAVRYIESRAGDKPFFLYLALTAPHGPIFPSPEFAGRTRTNAYGDFCVQLDATVGKVLDALDAAGLAQNTLVIFTADNGCAPIADFATLAKFHHDPSLGYRGAKADIYEGGHRLPFIARWPGHIPANTVSDELICQVDFYATCAAIVGAKIPDTAAEDSVSILPALLAANGKPAAPIHEAIVSHSDNGSFAIRQGPWKLCLCPDSGGWADPRPGTTPPDAPPFQLYNLADDPAEKTNLCAARPELVQRLGKLLIKYIRDGRSTPGSPQKNTGPEIWPQLAWMKHFE